MKPIIAMTFCGCCSSAATPTCRPTQQVALALRIVSGLTVPQIARAFLVGESAMEQRITRAKAKVAGAGVPFEAPNAVERAERLASVAAMVYLVFNEGYSAADPAAIALRCAMKRSASRACCCACIQASRRSWALLRADAVAALAHRRAFRCGWQRHPARMIRTAKMEARR
jgi:predicted RNA polymerase sigma factor